MVDIIRRPGIAPHERDTCYPQCSVCRSNPAEYARMVDDSLTGRRLEIIAPDKCLDCGRPLETPAHQVYPYVPDWHAFNRPR